MFKKLFRSKAKRIEEEWLKQEQVRREADPEAYYAQAFASASACLYEAVRDATNHTNSLRDATTPTER